VIGLSGLRINCIIGIHPPERLEEQPLLVDLEVERDFAAAAASDDFTHTSDYTAMADLLTELAQERQYQLLETFAEDAAALLLERFTEVERLRLQVRKPQAVPAADASFVRVERSREAE
jgi:dihydroneopterin aldolase